MEDYAGAPRISRRLFLEKFPRQSAIAGLELVGVGKVVLPIIGNFINYIPEAQEYLRNNGKIRLIFSNHDMPEPYGTAWQKVWTPYFKGDLNVSIWPQNTENLIDNRMQGAKKNGQEKYRLMVDSIGTNLSQIQWAAIPHPNFCPKISTKKPNVNIGKFALYQKSIEHMTDLAKVTNKYPNEFHIIGADIGEYGIGGNLFGLSEDFMNDLPKDVQEQYAALLGDINNLFTPYNPEVVNAWNTLLVSDIVKGTIDVAALTELKYLSENPTMGRRKAIKMGAAIALAASAVSTAQTSINVGAVDYEAGQSTDLAVQKFLAVVANTTEQSPSGVKSVDSLIRVRTALGIEKALAINEPIDLVYGSGHAFDTPRLMEDQTYRLQVTQDFFTNFFSQLDQLTQEKYPKLRQNGYFYRILAQIGTIIPKYTDYTISIPWGQKNTNPQYLNDFEKGLIQSQMTSDCMNIKNIMDSLLHQYTNSSSTHTVKEKRDVNVGVTPHS